MSGVTCLSFRSRSRAAARLVTLAGFALCVTLFWHAANAQTLAGVTGDIRVQGDFDGDGVLDYAYWRPSNGTWYIHLFANPSVLITQQWGTAGDIPVPGDYDGDGKTDYAVWRPSNGTWYIIPSRGTGAFAKQWGLAGDIPIAGDFDGDRITDFAVWRPSNGTWYVIPSASPSNPIMTQWGLPGDAPVPGDYDGDGKWDLAVYRSSNGTWYIIPSATPAAPIQFQWGAPGDIPAPADYDGDGKSDYAVYRPSESNMYFKLSGNPNGFSQAWTLPTRVISTKLGVGTLGRSLTVRVNGDFDGDGILDWAVWRPSDGMWFVAPSSNPAATLQVQWGAPGDIPVLGDYDADGKTDYVVWRPSNGVWYDLPVVGGSARVQQWGTQGDIPAISVGDFDSDAKADFAVWRPSNGVWYVIPSATPTTPAITQWGLHGDVPVAGETDGGNERTVPVIWRPSEGRFYVRSTTGATMTQLLGTMGDLPVAGDFNNDGGTDYMVWRPSAQSWFILVNHGSGAVTQVQLGFAGNELLYNEPPLSTFIGPN